MATELAVQRLEAPSPRELMQQAISQGGDPVAVAAVIQQLVNLEQSMIRFEWEKEERQAKIGFDEALNSCQSQLSRIAPNQSRENGIMWLDYAKLDKTVRPLYIEAGFSIAFSEEPTAANGKLRMKATLSRGGVSKEYFAEITRAPANSKMSQTDADAAAASRVKRYLMLDIFNIAVGIDKDEKVPVESTELNRMVDMMNAAADLPDLKEAYAKAFSIARELPDDGQSMKQVVKLFEELKKDFARKS